MPSSKKKRGSRSRDRRHRAGGVRNSGISRENMYNEVDEFHEQKDKIMMKKLFYL